MIVAGVEPALSRAPLCDDASRSHYLAALHEYGDLLDTLAERTRGQAEGGILLPRAQAATALDLLGRLRGGRTAALATGDARLAGQDGFKREAVLIIGGGSLGRWMTTRR